MKRLIMVAAAMLAAVALAEMSLADARGKIGKAVSDPRLMGEIVAQLSATNQVAFLADVNEAIASMPGSNDEKAAAFLDANEAALRNASKDNLQNLLAETFATVPTEALTVLNERLAADLFNRAADPANPISDADFTRLAQSTMEVIQERAAQTDDPGVRSTFALLMFVHASNGSPADLADTLVAGLPDASTRELARSDWIPAALGQNGEPPSYDSLVGASDGGPAPNFSNVIGLSASDGMSALLGDLGSSETTIQNTVSGATTQGLPGNTTYSGGDQSFTTIPETINPAAPWYSGDDNRGSGGESKGYAFQELD